MTIVHMIKLNNKNYGICLVANDMDYSVCPFRKVYLGLTWAFNTPVLKSWNVAFMWRGKEIDV